MIVGTLDPLRHRAVQEIRQASAAFVTACLPTFDPDTPVRLGPDFLEVSEGSRGGAAPKLAWLGKAFTSWNGLVEATV